MHDVNRNPMSRTYQEEVKTQLNKVVARIRLAPHLLVPGFDSGTVPHRPDVQGDNRQWEIPDLVFRRPVYRWSRLRDQNSLLSRMTVRRPPDRL